MRDDAAKIVINILLISIAVGVLVMGGYYLVAGEAYTPSNILASNKEAGFYPYTPPVTTVDPRR